MPNNTKRQIKDALMRLLEESSFDGISVQDLSDECGISRNTFYYHYHDKYEVLEDMFADQTKKSIGDANTWELWEDGILQALEFAINNKKAVYHVYNSLNRRELEKYLNRVMEAITMKFVKQQARGLKVSEDDEKLLVTFYKHGVTGVVLEWLDSGMKQEPGERIERMGYILRGSARKCLEKVSDK